MKRIAVFSDIHGNLEALESILKDIERNNIDEVIYLGDIIGLGPSPKECLDIIMDSRIKMIKGNHEIYQIDESNMKPTMKEHRDWINSLLDEKELDYIANLPMTYEELINGKLFTFSHFFFDETKTSFQPFGILEDNRIYDIARNVETDYMFLGHFHDNFQISNGSLYTCPGSSGLRKDNITFYTIVEIEEKNVRITRKDLEYDRRAFEKKMKQIDYPRKDELNEMFFGV